MPKGNGGSQEPHSPDNMWEQVEGTRGGVAAGAGGDGGDLREETAGVAEGARPEVLTEAGVDMRRPLRPLTKTGEATSSGESSSELLPRPAREGSPGERRRAGVVRCGTGQRRRRRPRRDARSSRSGRSERQR